MCAEERQSLRDAQSAAPSAPVQSSAPPAPAAAAAQPPPAQSTAPAESPPADDAASTADESELDTSWSHADTLLLIETYHEYRTKLLQPGKKKKEVWEQIAGKMNTVTQEDKFSGAKCSKKWSNLEGRYKEKRDKPKKTGRAGGKPWLYYDKLDAIIGSTAAVTSVRKACTAPGTSSSAADSQSRPLIASESDCESDVEAQEQAASTSVASPHSDAPTRKRKGDEPPRWLNDLVAELDSRSEKRRVEDRKQQEEWMTKQEEEIKKQAEWRQKQEAEMKERTDILRAMKDAFVKWAEK